MWCINKAVISKPSRVLTPNSVCGSLCESPCFTLWQHLDWYPARMPTNLWNSESECNWLLLFFKRNQFRQTSGILVGESFKISSWRSGGENWNFIEFYFHTNSNDLNWQSGTLPSKVQKAVQSIGYFQNSLLKTTNSITSCTIYEKFSLKPTV